jgi:L-aminopeptidase/D-esterase-like protein
MNTGPMQQNARRVPICRAAAMSETLDNLIRERNTKVPHADAMAILQACATPTEASDHGELDAARGAFWGVFLGATLWAGIIATVMFFC